MMVLVVNGTILLSSQRGYLLLNPRRFVQPGDRSMHAGPPNRGASGSGFPGLRGGLGFRALPDAGLRVLGLGITLKKRRGEL